MEMLAFNRLGQTHFLLAESTGLSDSGNFSKGKKKWLDIRISMWSFTLTLDICIATWSFTLTLDIHIYIWFFTLTLSEVAATVCGFQDFSSSLVIFARK